MGSTRHLHYKAKKYGLDFSDFLIVISIILFMQSIYESLLAMLLTPIAYLILKYAYVGLIPKGWFVFLVQKRRYVKWPYQIKEYVDA